MMNREKQQRVYFLILSLLAGFAAAYNLAFNIYRDSLKTNLDWIVMLSLVTFAFGAVFSLVLPYLWNRYQTSSILVRWWVLVLTLASALFFTFSSSTLVLLAAWIFQFLIC